ncbi:MAG: hypothetical protein J0H41_16400 [Rhizobiales bacterium]|nr:hypothetical protein [Hyphomicrobiales bacterium]
MMTPEKTLKSLTDATVDRVAAELASLRCAAGELTARVEKEVELHLAVMNSEQRAAVAELKLKTASVVELEQRLKAALGVAPAIPEKSSPPLQKPRVLVQTKLIEQQSDAA